MAVNRREFLGSAAAAMALSRTAWPQAVPPGSTAENLIAELYSGLTADQKNAVVLPYDDPRRQELHDQALGKKIGQVYTKPQQDLLARILRSLTSGEDGWRQISRDGTWDESQAFENCGAELFGDLKDKYTWVFSGHHLTLRCDGKTAAGVALGGPMYYGHTPDGYSEKNLFRYQTKSALAVYDALDKNQRVDAVTYINPGEGIDSLKFRCACDSQPGIAYEQLSKEIQGLLENLLKDVLSPFRKEDADEVRRIIQATGGMNELHLMVYSEADGKPWSFWRLEGPGFIWNFRVLPHVHTYVNVSSNIKR
jgi:hypothetical protein